MDSAVAWLFQQSVTLYPGEAFRAFALAVKLNKPAFTAQLLAFPLGVMAEPETLASDVVGFVEDPE